jgi:hypothetical protein
MNDLKVGTVWKSKQFLGYMVEVISVDGETMTYRDLHPNSTAKSRNTNKFMHDFEYYKSEYKLPYDVGTEYV